MKIYTTIDNAGQFRDELFRANRGEQFSYEACNALFNYIESLEEDYELDVIALCCDWSELDEETLCKEYGLDDASEIEDKTIAIKLSNGCYLIQLF